MNGTVIEKGDLFGLTYYEYGANFFGSIKGMRYRVARDPQDDVHFKKPQDRGTAEFEVNIWRGPYSYDKTGEEMTTSKFPFTEEGMDMVIAYLNNAYVEKEEYWESWHY